MPQDERVLASIYEVFRHNSQKSYTIDKLDRELHNKLHYKFTELVRGVTFLEHEKKIITDGLGKYQLNRLDTIVEGTFRANDKGFGFIRYDEVADDIFVDKTNTSFAIDGDTVKAKIIADANPWNGKGPEGQVVEIIERGFENLVGEFIPFSDQQVATTNYLGYVISENKKLKKYKIYILKDGLTPQLGDIVQVSLKTYPSEESPEDMTAVVIKVIGNKNDPGVDIMAIVADHDVKTEWSDEALEQANQIPDHVTAADKSGREDITQQAAVTIDGDDSKDFDDAVVLWKLDNGNYHLGVHIADVAHYVTEGSPLDIEAFTRGNSTYLVDRVIPMLPFRLSNGICSLNEGVERLVLSCDMEITPTGERVNYSIHPSVMKSHGRLTYSKVNRALAGDHLDELEEKYRTLRPMLVEMAKLHDILYQKRHKRGAIDFEEPEAKIIVDKMGKPIDIVLHERGTAEKMVESFMLLANETVAEEYFRRHVPFLYRVHETPDEEKMKTFFEFVSAFGLNVKADPHDVKPSDLQQIVTKTAGTTEEAVVQMMMLRSLRQAHYSAEPLGHFGLAAQYYTHFTSPIRRYSDLIVHRMIHEYGVGKPATELQKHFQGKLDEIAEQTSVQERRSIDTERSVNDLKMTEYMANQVGEHFDAIISSVTSFGMFIQLSNTVEGLIHISNLTDDFYRFDEKSLTLTGRGKHHQFKVGMPIKVKLINADVAQHQIDFEIYDPNTPKIKNNDHNQTKTPYRQRTSQNNRPYRKRNRQR